MPPHWESSNKPLFIKTIWKDGQHHVLLKKETFTNQIPRYSSPRTPKRSPRINQLTSEGPSNIRISSFKLLDMKQMNRRDTLIRCKTSPHSEISNRIDSINPNFAKQKEVGLSNKKLNLTIKSNSIDITENRYECGYIEASKDIECRTLGLNNPELNILSQRVLVWLDLALQQNKKVDKNIAFQNNKVSHIPSTLPQKTVKVLKARKSAPIYVKEKETCFNDLNEIFHVGPVPELTKTSNSRSTSSRSFSEDLEHRINLQGVEEQLFISSIIENGLEVPNITDKMESVKTNPLKRQIHIFMPALQNKMDDCESSILSSN